MAFGKPRLPCKGCGGEKGPGERRRYCDACQPRARAAQRARDYAARDKWAAEHRDEISAHQREKRLDPEWVARRTESDRRWREANPERASENRRRCVARYRARKAGGYVEEVEPLVVLEQHDGVCGICGEDVDPFAFEVDHVVPIVVGGLHEYANCQVAHRSCNRSKGARFDPDAFVVNEMRGTTCQL